MNHVLTMVDLRWYRLIVVDIFVKTWVDDPAVSHDRSRHLGAPVLTCNSSAQQIRPQYVPVSCKKTVARHLGLGPFLLVKTWVAFRLHNIRSFLKSSTHTVGVLHGCTNNHFCHQWIDYSENWSWTHLETVVFLEKQSPPVIKDVNEQSTI